MPVPNVAAEMDDVEIVLKTGVLALLNGREVMWNPHVKQLMLLTHHGSVSNHIFKMSVKKKVRNNRLNDKNFSRRFKELIFSGMSPCLSAFLIIFQNNKIDCSIFRFFFIALPGVEIIISWEVWHREVTKLTISNSNLVDYAFEKSKN